MHLYYAPLHVPLHSSLCCALMLLLLVMCCLCVVVDDDVAAVVDDDASARASTHATYNYGTVRTRINVPISIIRESNSQCTGYNT